MTITELFDNFWEKKEELNLGADAIALYMYLLRQFEKRSVNPIDVSVENIRFSLKIGSKAFTHAKELLEVSKLIKIIPGSKGATNKGGYLLLGCDKKEPAAPAAAPKKVPPVSVPKDGLFGERSLKNQWEQLDKDGKTVTEFVQTYRPRFSEPYVYLWNRWAEVRGVDKSQVKSITTTRKDKLKSRLEEKEFDIVAILKAASESKLCRTKSWFTYDFIIHSQDNYIKLLEGKYKDGAAEVNSQTPEQPQNEANLKMLEALNRAKKNG